MIEKTITIIATVLSGLLVIALQSIAFYFLWNWLIPNIFNLPYIDLIEAYGLLLFLFLLKFLLSTKIHTEIE